MATQKIYDMVTERVVAKIEEAIKDGATVAPWQRPWHQTGMPTNLVSKKPYRGMNVFLLSMMGFSSPYFVTFKQAKKLGGEVKKGAKGLPVVFWKWVNVSKDDEGNELESPRKIPFLRYYTVFNVSQVDGIDDKIPQVEARTFSPIEEAEAIAKGFQNAPEVHFKGGQACYAPSIDEIRMPAKETFKGDEEYYATLFHEMAHATGHSSRLNRKEVMDANAFGSHDYSVEELVAEMTAVFLCNECGLEQPFNNSLAYLKGWLSKLKDDTKMLVTASGRAQKAADHILGTEYKPKEEND